LVAAVAVADAAAVDVAVVMLLLLLPPCPFGGLLSTILIIRHSTRNGLGSRISPPHPHPPLPLPAAKLIG